MEFKKPEWIVSVRNITPEVYEAWFKDKNRPRKPLCEICGSEIKVGQSFGCTYSNFGGHNGGNPITGECCFHLSWEEKLLIWDKQREITENLAKYAYESYKRELARI